MLKKVVTFLILALWPINLYLNNAVSDFFSYTSPVLLLGLSLFLYKKYPNYYLIPLVFIGVFETKLLIFPIVFIGIEMLSKFTLQKLILFTVSLALLLFSFSEYKGQTVFNKDYEAEQLVVRNIHLYPNTLTARVFQNKPRIYINKIANNFFVLNDPNNYFFGFHPRQITVDNQNLYKYPFITLLFTVYGIYFVRNYSAKKFLILSFVSSITSLSILTNFDRHDFILWLPISIVTIHGINMLQKNNRNLFNFISILLFIFATPQLLRSFIERVYK